MKTAMMVGAAAMIGAWAATAQAQTLSLEVRSSDPARVTGGDALIAVTGNAAAPVSVTVNGRDVSGVFKDAKQPGQRLGLVTDLGLGDNTIVAKQGDATATLKVVNHPITGPLFAGPKEKPFFCETTEFKLADGKTLPAAKDENCSVDTVVTYVYKTKIGEEWKPLPSRTQLPADIASVKTTAGATVPYVVRVEAGTIDRGIYQIAVLHDPTKESEPTAVAPPKAWNNRMVYVYAGGCLGTYRQGPRTGPLLDDQFLAHGFLTMSNSLNVFATQCDDLLSAEATAMTKERALELVGSPLYTLGWGCSGGSHQVLQIADNYPGLLDGIIPMCNSVDWGRFQQFYSDVKLAYDWFATPAAKALTEAQKNAITGTPQNTTASELGRNQASVCPPVVPKEMVYDAETNPKGVRCSMTQHQVNSIGVNPATGFAWNLVDNVGVQYGLGALESGVITTKQFLDLNEQIGGYDVDGERTSQRSIADPIGLENYYRAGRVLNAGLGLRDVPILELRNYSDKDEDASHTKYSTFVTLARLERETGGRANYVALLESHKPGFMSASSLGGDAMSHYALKKMDEWLTALKADKSAGSLAEKVVRAKPEDLMDACYDEEGELIVEEQKVSGGRCNELYPTHLPPRMVAGGPLTNDILKCQLKPVNAADYKVKFTEAELTRLKAVFPQGVCDWSKKGVGQVPPKGTWQSF